MAGFVMKMNTYIIDAFTSVAFKGNPTGVCYVENAINEDKMLALANELNFPVTAFVQKISPQQYAIRYFTPTTEIPACGHATLAAAKATTLEDGTASATFHTTEGIALKTTAEGELIMMTYPKYEMRSFPVTNEILQGLDLKEFKTAGYCPELETLFIETDPKTLRAIQPDYARLVKSSDAIIEVVITSVADSNEHDYLLRSFCPWIGIDEDPVTGSVHTVLSGFWKDRLHKSTLKAYQASARGGELVVKAYDDKTEIGGKAIIILKGQIDLQTTY